jgi:hypothetical protein
MGDSDPGYQFGSGIGEHELARLEAQGAALAPATRMIFAEGDLQDPAPGGPFDTPRSNPGWSKRSPRPGSPRLAHGCGPFSKRPGCGR